MPTITFLGAAKTVTGSKYLITHHQNNFLIDCGLFQGLKELRLRNWAPFPFEPQDIQQVILTHAHIDHSGAIPLLVKKGFRGKIYASESTRDLCAVLLPDSGHLQEEEAYYANKHGYSKHHPALPLYTREEAEAAMSYFYPVHFAKKEKINDDISFELFRAGHILGASFVDLNIANTHIIFSGDIGRFNDPLMLPPTQMHAADYIVVESTYGNRVHDPIDPLTQLAESIQETVKKGGSVVIPAFAVGRTQNILYYLFQLKTKKMIPDIPIYVDSPMAIDATQLFCAHHQEHRLSQQLTHAVCRIAKYVHSVEDSKQLDAIKTPRIIISASGMMTGGRILHHIKALASDSRNAILITGFQGPGTRGADLLDGKTQLKMLGEIVTIKARVYNLLNMSAHADSTEIMQWLGYFVRPPKKIFITHGEPASQQALKKQIEETFGWDCVIPDYESEFELS